MGGEITSNFYFFVLFYIFYTFQNKHIFITFIRRKSKKKKKLLFLKGIYLLTLLPELNFKRNSQVTIKK